jgi:uncharacterized membrane protein
VLLRLLSTVLYACADDPDQWATLEDQAKLVLAAAEREVVEPTDLALVHAEADALSQSLAARRAGKLRGPADAPRLPKTSPPT